MIRREFLRNGLITASATAFLTRTEPARGKEGKPVARACRVIQAGSAFELHGPEFVFKVDTSAGLRALSWENNLTGRTISLRASSELDVEVDAAEQRIWIPGWKGSVSHTASADPNQDLALKEGYARPDYDDSKWRGMI
ncbi:MAG TPA: hypothetical protein VFD30_00375 [Terriglobia bacterium]|nr:hypothetical protein [Terriglobia bacterium]